jgi:hypothetical protein
MDWKVIVLHRDGTVEEMYCVTRAEARAYAQTVRPWPSVVKATVSRV